MSTSRSKTSAKSFSQNKIIIMVDVIGKYFEKILDFLEMGVIQFIMLYIFFAFFYFATQKYGTLRVLRNPLRDMKGQKKLFLTVISDY